MFILLIEFLYIIKIYSITYCSYTLLIDHDIFTCWYNSGRSVRGTVNQSRRIDFATFPKQFRLLGAICWGTCAWPITILFPTICLIYIFGFALAQTEADILNFSYFCTLTLNFYIEILSKTHLLFFKSININKLYTQTL